jgi:hypothetical protein
MGLLSEKISGNNLNKPWVPVELDSIDEIFVEMAKLQSNSWVSRGQAKYYGEQLFPPIDRIEFNCLARIEKLALEQKSFYLFRSNIRYFSEGERESLHLDIPALMLMQHNGVPTRLLDWSMSPFVSLYFACRKYFNNGDWENGEIWAFDYHQYDINASKQWGLYSETQIETEKGKIFNDEMPVIFSAKGPEYLWFVLQFLRGDFSRLGAQKGLFSVVSKFGIDHAGAIRELFGDDSFIKRFIIKKEFKNEIRNELLRNYNIWEGSLFPDSAGVAEAIAKDVFGFNNVWIYNGLPNVKHY